MITPSPTLREYDMEALVAERRRRAAARPRLLADETRGRPKVRRMRPPRDDRRRGHRARLLAITRRLQRKGKGGR